jgi:hypothetical protein
MLRQTQNKKHTAHETRRRRAGIDRNPKDRVFLPWFESETGFKPEILDAACLIRIQAQALDNHQ